MRTHEYKVAMIHWYQYIIDCNLFHCFTFVLLYYITGNILVPCKALYNESMDTIFFVLWYFYMTDYSWALCFYYFWYLVFEGRVLDKVNKLWLYSDYIFKGYLYRIFTKLLKILKSSQWKYDDNVKSKLLSCF